MTKTIDSFFNISFQFMSSSTFSIFNETEIWLDEDMISVFADKFWSIEFYVGLFIIIAFVMVHIFCSSFLRPSQYDKHQKLLKITSYKYWSSATKWGWTNFITSYESQWGCHWYHLGIFRIHFRFGIDHEIKISSSM